MCITANDVKLYGITLEKLKKTYNNIVIKTSEMKIGLLSKFMTFEAAAIYIYINLNDLICQFYFCRIVQWHATEYKSLIGKMAWGARVKVTIFVYLTILSKNTF